MKTARGKAGVYKTLKEGNHADRGKSVFRKRAPIEFSGYYPGKGGRRTGGNGNGQRRPALRSVCTAGISHDGVLRIFPEWNAGIRFRGVVGFLLLGGREYRFAAYLGAVVTKMGDRELRIRRERYRILKHALSYAIVAIYCRMHPGWTRIRCLAAGRGYLFFHGIFIPVRTAILTRRRQ